ncbi:MAG: hypothetical protein HDT43_11300 [Ruminococcaceae bacterium]|nr:hypothetical protein [Oscillospiraceae bacterium]
MDGGQIEFFKQILDSLDNPAAVLDGSFHCVYSNRSDFSPFENVVRGEIQQTVLTVVVSGGVTYCARICPLDGFFLCELFDSDAVISIAENTDIRGRLTPLFNAVEHNTSKLWKTLFAMRDCIANNEDISGFEARFYDRISELSSVIKNGVEYSLMHTNFSPMLIDAVSLTDGIVNRCNTILARCGRCIRFVCECDRLLITADMRHTITAHANSLQNALLFSPRDCVPVLSLVRLTENGERFVYLQLVNDSVLFVDKGFGEKDIDFGYQRVGFGIPIIKRFAEETGGSFFLDASGKTVKLGIKLPEADASEVKGLRVEECGYTHYDTGIPDIIDVKMHEVVSLFT